MNITLRKFAQEDIPLKCKWINDPCNNEFLHYDLPLDEERTIKWFNSNLNNKGRLDLTICDDDSPIGVTGLLNIDLVGKVAEFYITVGEQSYKHKGVSQQVISQIKKIAVEQFGLSSIVLSVDADNSAAVKAYEKAGFVRTASRKKDIPNKYGVLIDRYDYSLSLRERVK